MIDNTSLIVDILLSLPHQIAEIQRLYNGAERQYQAALADKTIEALEAPLFNGKDGAKRAAANDTERAAAVAKLTATDETLARLAERRDEMHARLQCARNIFDGAMRAARLLSRETI